VPPAQWYNDKGILRIAMRGVLPRAVVQRNKAPLARDPVAAVRQRDGKQWLGGAHVTENVAAWVRPIDVPRETGGQSPAPVVDLHTDLRPLILSRWLG
jgi:hypothetical protein